MKRRITTMITTLALAGSLMLLATATAVADDGVPACPPGPTLNGAAHQSNVESWELMSEGEFATHLATPPHISQAQADLQASITYDFCDKNEDGYACVMLQPLPGGTYWLAEDNHFAQGPGRR